MNSSHKCDGCSKWHYSKKQRTRCKKILQLKQKDAAKIQMAFGPPALSPNEGQLKQQFQVKSKHQKNQVKHSLEQSLSKIIQKPFMILNQDLETLYEYKSKKKIQIASTTKLLNLATCSSIMTEFGIDEETPVEVPQNLKIFDNETQAYLAKGEVLTIHQLFLCMIISSAGDAAFALADFFGSKLKPDVPDRQATFIEKMYEVGMQVGMKKLALMDCRGAKQNYSTVEGLILLLRYVYQRPNLRKYFKIQQIKIYGKKNQQLCPHQLSSTNNLMRKQFFGKTGITPERLTGFVGFKEFQKRAYFIGIFECRDAERWILLRKVIEICQKLIQ